MAEPREMRDELRAISADSGWADGSNAKHKRSASQPAGLDRFMRWSHSHLPSQREIRKVAGAGPLPWPKRRIRRHVAIMIAAVGLVLLAGVWWDSSVRGGRPATNCPAVKYGSDTNAAQEERNRGRRVLLITGSYMSIIDGVAYSLNHLVRDLNRDGYRVLVAAPDGNFDHSGAVLPMSSFAVPNRPEYQVSVLDRCLAQAAASFRPDIVHIATPDIAGHQMQQWAITRRIPVVCSFHTNFHKYLPYFFGKGMLLDAVDTTARWVGVRFYNSCDHIYLPSFSLADELVEMGFEAKRFRLWPRGIDVARFSPSHRSDAVRRSWNVTDDRTVVLLLVSRVVWEKNIQVFVDVAKALVDRGLPVKPVVVGQGPALDKMKAMLPSAVFVGSASGSALFAAYASGDVFFFPSTTETWGAVTVEALASGLAVVVASGPGGGGDLVRHNDTGLVVNVTNLNATVDAMEELVSSAGMRARLAARALEYTRSRSHWTWEHANGILKGHYQEIAERVDTSEKFGWLQMPKLVFPERDPP